MFRRCKPFLLIPLFLAASCERNEGEKESGKIVRESVAVDNYDRIEFSGNGNLVIKQGDVSTLQIEADNSIIPLIKTKVLGGILHLGAPADESWGSKPITYYAVVKELKKVALTGEGKISSEDPVIGDYLILEIAGSGSINLDINAKELTVDLSGSGKAVISGLADKQKISIAEMGSFDGKKLLSKSAEVRIAGNGKAILNAVNELDVSITGKGSVEYTGSPKLTTQIAGEGKIQKIEK
jgi:hypothetical protein